MKLLKTKLEGKITDRSIYSMLYSFKQNTCIKLLVQITRDLKKVADDNFEMETALSGKAPRWSKEEVSTLVYLVTENASVIKGKFTQSLTSSDTNHCWEMITATLKNIEANAPLSERPLFETITSPMPKRSLIDPHFVKYQSKAMRSFLL